MCGYVGDGVDYFDTDYVIDIDEETGRYVRKPNPDTAVCQCDQDEAIWINGTCGYCGYPARVTERDGRIAPAEKPSTLAFLAGVAAGLLGL